MKMLNLAINLIYNSISGNSILGINLTKQVKVLYMETCKTLMKEIEEDTNKWRDISCSLIRRINSVKMSILPKAICRVNTIPNKILITFPHRNRKKKI